MRIHLDQFSQLLELIAEALDIPENHYEQAVKRYEAIGMWLKRKESKLVYYNPEIYPQGSFALGTVKKAISDDEEYDLDFVSKLSIQKSQVSQKQLKDLVGAEIKAYARANNMNSPAEEGRRCWTLNYADGAQFHMDILPAIPDTGAFQPIPKSSSQSPSIWSDSVIAITDNKLPNYTHINPDWPRSNPQGYTAWFRSCMESQFNARQRSLAESLRAQVQDVPEYKVKTPLQQAIQILKRHRDIMFDQNPDDKPVSIIITTLAGHAYNNEPNLLDALQNLVKYMPRYIRNINGVAFIPDPVNPLENFADKWQEHPQREGNFYKWLQQVQQDLGKVLELDDIAAVGESLKACLGERVVNETLRNFPGAKSGYAPTIAASIPRTLSRFNVPHRQTPEWPVILNGSVRIIGKASGNGFRTRKIQSNSPPLPKQWSLQFEAQTDVSPPYEVHWQVVNTGNEALEADGLRGDFYKGTLKEGRQVREESTEYKGMHWIECFIIQDGICRARSGEFVVNIA